MRLIDADALVKEAERLYGEWNKAMAGAEGTRQINKVYKMQELSEAVAEVARHMTTYAPHPYEMRWIPCSERLPEMHEEEVDGEFYKASDRLLFSSAAGVCCGFYEDSAGGPRWYEDYVGGPMWYSTEGLACENVTAWMPMPQTYKED